MMIIDIYGVYKGTRLQAEDKCIYLCIQSVLSALKVY